MKTYILTEQDIERLKDKLITEDFIIDKWAETLEEGEDKYYCECEEKDLNFMCPCIQRQ